MRTIAGGPGRYTKKQQKNEGKRGVNCLKLSHTKAAARKQRWTPDRRQQTGDRSGCSCLLLRSADETNHIISRRRCCTLFLKKFRSFRFVRPPFDFRRQADVAGVWLQIVATRLERGSSIQPHTARN